MRYLHLGCQTGAFFYKKVLEEGIFKLVLDYVGPPLRTTCNSIRPFIRMDYITGYRMPKERVLGIRYRDPEALESPDKDHIGMITQPINTRLNVDVSSTFHTPHCSTLTQFTHSLCFLRICSFHSTLQSE